MAPSGFIRGFHYLSLSSCDGVLGIRKKRDLPKQFMSWPSWHAGPISDGGTMVQDRADGTGKLPTPSYHHPMPQPLEYPGQDGFYYLGLLMTRPGKSWRRCPQVLWVPGSFAHSSFCLFFSSSIQSGHLVPAKGFPVPREGSLCPSSHCDDSQLLPRCLLPDPDVPLLNVIPFGSCWVQIWKCGLMGYPELMGFPCHVTLLGALQTCYFSLKEETERWEFLVPCQALSEEEILMGGLFSPLDIDGATRFCCQGRGERGPFFLKFLHRSCTVDAKFVCGRFGQVLDDLPLSWVRALLLSGSGFETWGSLPMSVMSTGDNCANPSSKLQRVNWVMQHKHIPDSRLDMYVGYYYVARSSGRSGRQKIQKKP